MERTLKILPWIVGLAFFIQWFDTAALNTALPTIAKDLNQSTMQMQSLVICFMLTVAFFMPMSGWLGDKFGIKAIFMFAVSVFMAGSIICAVSQTLSVLLTGKIIQGVGGAFLLPISRLAIIKTSSRDRLTGLLSFIAIPGLVGLFLGPIVSGVLSTYASWRWIFLINLPAGVLTMFAAHRYIPALKAVSLPQFDWWGFLFIGTAIFASTLGMEAYVSLGWSSAYILLMAVLALTGVIGYVLYATRAENPLFELTLFKIPTFTIGVFGNVFTGLTGGAMPFITPLLLQVGLGLSPSLAGAIMAPGAVMSIFAKNIVPFLLKKVGHKRFLCVNTLLLGASILLFTKIGPHTDIAIMVLFMAIYSGINSLQFTATFTMSVIDLTAKNASSGNTLFSVISQLSIGISVGIAAILMAFFSVGEWDSSSLATFHNTYLCLAIANMSAVMLFLFMPRHAGE